MTRATDSVPPSSAAADAAHGYVCPFCGLTREITPDFDASSPCPRCTLADTPSTRGATKARVGPWHVRQVRNPWAPGMRFETLMALIKRGQVTRDSIVRGPTTHQLWKRAAEVKGVSREFGACYSCGGEIDARANLCPHCNRLQEPPVDPDSLIETRQSAAGSGQSSARFIGAGPGSMPVPRPNSAREMVPRANLPAPTGPAGKDVAQPMSDEQTARARQITSRPPAANRKVDSRPSAPTGDRPVAIRPRTPGADDALLTPQELATAFQLDFSPEKPRRRRGAKILVALLMVLLLGGAAAALGYLRPDLRKASIAWGQRVYGQAKVFIASRTRSSAPVTPPAIGSGHHATARAGQDGAHVTSATKTPQESKQTAPTVASADKTGVKPNPEPAPAKAQALPSVDVVVTPSIPPAGPKNSGSNDAAEASAHLSPPSVNPPVPAHPGAEVSDAHPADQAAPAPNDAGADPYVQAKRLWVEAIDAEAGKDYAGAVKYYEQIKKLPADVHPWGLDERLEWARKQIK